MTKGTKIALWVGGVAIVGIGGYLVYRAIKNKSTAQVDSAAKKLREAQQRVLQVKSDPNATINQVNQALDVLQKAKTTFERVKKEVFTKKATTPSNKSTQYDSEGYDKNGFDKYGFDRDGFDKDGYDVYGYDIYGFDEWGFDEFGNFIDDFNSNSDSLNDLSDAEYNCYVFGDCEGLDSGIGDMGGGSEDYTDLSQMTDEEYNCYVFGEC